MTGYSCASPDEHYTEHERRNRDGDASAELYPAERASSARSLINGEHR